MGLIKDRNGMGLTEAEDIKKRWQEHSKKLGRAVSRPPQLSITKGVRL